jgi:hypothetical protein
MFQDVFDDVERSAMGRAIDQIMQSAGEEARLRRLEVANTVIVVACESHEFDPSKLAALAPERLGLVMTNGPRSEKQP